MGADMLVTCFVGPINEGKPNWTAGEDLIKSLTQIHPDVEHLGESLDEIKDRLLSKLESVKNAYEFHSRELTDIEIGPYMIYVTGGMCSGDAPTELFDDIYTLNTLEVLDACGFNQIIDHKQILEKLLSHKEVLPLLVGIDPDLDKMISYALNPPKKRKKNAKK